MNSCLKNEIPASPRFAGEAGGRRCRPLLGTFVEIVVKDDNTTQAHHARLDEPKARQAIDAAFAAIERVHTLMSFHDPDSEVSRLNRLAYNQKIFVSSETYEVLQYAKQLHELSDGVFDITIASQLIDSGLLPRHNFLKEHKNYSGTTADIELLPDGFVRFVQSMCIDLGGIAKGFAVDQAIETLKKNGIVSGLVNAGGDMRAFGQESWPVWVRHPKISGQFQPLPDLENAALATSANSYENESILAQIHGRTREFLRRPFSVSVRASSCVIADALTKVVMALAEQSESILSQLGAAAFIAYPDNRIVCYESVCQ